MERWKRRSRASMSALDSVGPVAHRMRRILSSQDLSTIGKDYEDEDEDWSPSIYDQMRAISRSRDDLTDQLHRNLLQKPKPEIKKKKKPKCPEGEVEIFVDEPAEVYRPIVHRRRHERARQERRKKMSAEHPDADLTNNNRVSNGQYSTLDRLVREQTTDYDSSASNTLERPQNHGDKPFDTLDRLSKRQKFDSVSKTEFEQLCVFNKEERQESDTDTLTPSPRDSPKVVQRRTSGSESTESGARTSVVISSSADVNVAPAERERRPSVKDAISIFEKLNGEPRRIISDQYKDRKSTIVDDPPDILVSKSEVFDSENVKPSYKCDENVVGKSRTRSCSDDSGEEMNRKQTARYGTEIWAAPEPPKSVEVEAPRHSPSHKSRRDKIRTPSPRRFIKRPDPPAHDQRASDPREQDLRRPLPPRMEPTMNDQRPLFVPPRRESYDGGQSNRWDADRPPYRNEHVRAFSEDDHCRPFNVDYHQRNQYNVDGDMRRPHGTHRRSGAEFDPRRPYLERTRSDMDGPRNHSPHYHQPPPPPAWDPIYANNYPMNQGRYSPNHGLYGSPAPSTESPPPIPRRSREVRKQTPEEFSYNGPPRGRPNVMWTVHEHPPPYRPPYPEVYGDRPNIPLSPSGRPLPPEAFPPRPMFPEHYLGPDQHTYEYISPVRSGPDTPWSGPVDVRLGQNHHPFHNPSQERYWHEQNMHFGGHPPPEPHDFHDPRYAVVQKNRGPMYRAEDHDAVYLPPENQRPDHGPGFGRCSPDFMRQAVQYGYRPYPDNPRSRRSYPSYRDHEPYNPPSGPAPPEYNTRLDHHAFPYQLNPSLPVEPRPEQVRSSPNHAYSVKREEYLVRREYDPGLQKSSDTPQRIESVDRLSGISHAQPEYVVPRRKTSNETNEFYSEFSFGRPGQDRDEAEAWRYGDHRHAPDRRPRTSCADSSQKEEQRAFNQDRNPDSFEQTQVLKAQLKYNVASPRTEKIGFRDGFQISPHRRQSLEKGDIIHKTPDEKLQSSRIELDRAMEDLSRAVNIEIPPPSSESKTDATMNGSSVVYNRMSDTVMRRSRPPSTEPNRDTILIEKGVIFHNAQPKVTVKNTKPEPARSSRSSSDAKVESKVKPKRPTHLPLKVGYSTRSLSSSVPSLVHIGEGSMESMRELDNVLNDLKRTSVPRRTGSESGSPRRRTRGSVNSESDSSMISDSGSASENFERRRMRDVWCGSPLDYLVQRPPDPRRNDAITPERRPCAFHDDLAYRNLNKTSRDHSSSRNNISPGTTKPVAQGVGQLITKLLTGEETDSGKKSRSLPDLSSSATFTVVYNDNGDIISDDPRYSQHAVSPRKTPRSVKVRSKMRQRIADLIANTDGAESPEYRNPIPDLLQYDDSASEDASHEFELDKRNKYRREPLNLDVYNPHKQTVELIRDHYAAHEQTFNNVVSYFEDGSTWTSCLRKYASHDDITKADSRIEPTFKFSPQLSSLRERSGSDPCLSEGRTLERKKKGVYRSVLHFTVGSEEDLRTTGRPPRSHHRIDVV